MRQRLTHEQLCDCVEIEPTPEEEWSALYREWKQEELKDLWLELKRVEHSYLRRIKNQKKYIEARLGVRLNVKIPRQVIDAPARIAHLVEQHR